MFQQTGFGSLLKEVSSEIVLRLKIGLKALLWPRGGNDEKH
jgi:hypothetical protein